MAGSPNGHLGKDITLFGAFAIALGTTISSGFFLLPGLAFAAAGPAILIAYLIAGLIIIPPLLCKAELATAMPRAGGVYFYLDRSLGPMAGAISGIGTWISLTLKTSFALVGSGYYIGLFVDDPPVTLIAVGLALLFMVVNMLGTAKVAMAQNLLVIGVLLLLTWFSIAGLPEIQASHFDDFAPKGTGSIISLVGVVMISYMGISKLASVAEEIRNPERNIPIGIFLALATAIIIYMVGISVIIGVVPAEQLANTYTPAADAAAVFGGSMGRTLIAFAGIAAFLSVGNAGILSASRYPLAMARDHLAPMMFRKIGRFNAPTNAIIATSLLIILQVIFLDPLVIAKYAGTTKMILFALLSIAVIVMRESRIDSYDPGFKTPFYPLTPILGFTLCVSVILLLKWEAAVFAAGLIAASILWFFAYARTRVRRYGAIYHVFARLGENRFDPLDIELRSIIKEKGLRKADPFDEVVALAEVIEAPQNSTFESVIHAAADAIVDDVPIDRDELVETVMQGTRIGATPVTHAVALPHLRVAGLDGPRMVVVRSKSGIDITFSQVIGGNEVTETVRAIFLLVSPEDDPGQHLRLLAQLAGRVDQDDFQQEWLAATDAQQIKEVLLRDDHFLSIHLDRGQDGEQFIDEPLSQVPFPSQCLVAMIVRSGELIVPRGSTILRDGDRLTVIGQPASLNDVRRMLEFQTTDPIDDI